MKIFTIKTNKIDPTDKHNLYSLLDTYLACLREKSILAVTSKIVSICEGKTVKIGKISKRKLVKKEAEYYLSNEDYPQSIMLTIKNNILIPTAGVDESNGNGYYILWPVNPQKTANKIREYLKKRFKLQDVGVIITDSKTSPLRWGTTGIALTHSGFSALNDYIGTKDIFGRQLKVTKANVADALAVCAVLLMGEGSEQTPFVIAEDLPFIRFQNRNPSKKEIKELKINLEDDIYAPLLKSVRWQKGKA